MKSIEERAAIYFGVLEEKRLRRVVFEDILRELAADLQAEKEKEVSELREELLAFGKYVADRYDDAVLYKRSVKLSGGIDGDLSLIVSAQRAVQLISESEESGWVVKAVDAKHILINAIQNHPDTYLLDEVKRVLGAVAGCKLFYEDTMDIDNHTTDDVNNPLTRLGGASK